MYRPVWNINSSAAVTYSSEAAISSLMERLSMSFPAGQTQLSQEWRYISHPVLENMPV